MSSFLRVKLRFALACSDGQKASAADAIDRLVIVNSVKELRGISHFVGLPICNNYSTTRKVYAFPIEPPIEEVISPGTKNAYSPGDRWPGSATL